MDRVFRITFLIFIFSGIWLMVPSFVEVNKNPTPEAAYRDAIVVLQDSLNTPNPLEVASVYDVDANLAWMIYTESVRVGIPFEVAIALVKVESDFRPNAVSSAGALGLTQVKLSTAREIAPEIARDALLEPRTNLRVGFTYLQKLVDLYDGDMWMALSAYNAGPTRVNRSHITGEYNGSSYASEVLNE